MAYILQAIKKMELTWVPSVTNFVLINVERDGAEIFQALLRKGVIVRPMIEYNYPTYIRVTIGTPEENERFIRALGEVLGKS